MNFPFYFFFQSLNSSVTATVGRDGGSVLSPFPASEVHNHDPTSEQKQVKNKNNVEDPDASTERLRAATINRLGDNLVLVGSSASSRSGTNKVRQINRKIQLP